MSKTPQQIVNEEHGGKDKLVAQILGLIERDGTSKDDVKERLLTASNRKLLRLVKNAHTLKNTHESRAKLAATIAGKAGRAKDKDYIQHLASLSDGHLLSMEPHAGSQKKRRTSKKSKK